jgi:hypothetical protein
VSNLVHYVDSSLGPRPVGSTSPLPVSLTGTSGGPQEVEIKNDSGSAVPTEPLGIPGVARQLTATATSANTALTAACRRISMFARGSDIRYAVGATSQTANASTSHYIAVGERIDIAVPVSANIAVIRDTAAVSNGTLCITELL